jgi:hypothetical protein
MGGEITWECQGNGEYVFQLVIYRDCNGQDITDPMQTIEVWNHPTLTEIPCSFSYSEDLSPQCTEVIGGPIELDCGNGSSQGNGPGAIERFVYISQSITLGGIPPAAGFAFTHDSFSRNNDLDNISSPSTTGMTIWAKMYAYNGADASPCYDSSPQFGQNPLSITCAGTEFTIEQNIYDSDGDSLAFEWGVPLDHFLSGSFDPPTNPSPVGYNSGYSFNNPTPDASFDPGNIASILDPNTGKINFTSNTIGNYAVNVLISAFRNGIKISETSREIQVIVIACPNYLNTAPDVLAPFDGATSFDTIVNAGALINFDFTSVDVEFLQDGSNQSNILTPSGGQFGAGFTDPNNGCDEPPCATLSTGTPITGSHGLSTEFNWQTDCSHATNSDGTPILSREFSFVFKVSDDYCTIPLTTFATINITVVGKEALDAPKLNCLAVDAAGDVTINWEKPSDPTGSFLKYEIHSVQDGLISTVNDYNTETFIHTGASADVSSKDYFIVLFSGCDGIIKSESDTLKTIYLDLTNPNNGTAVLNWNQPGDYQSEWSDHFKIYMEYPIGTWILIDSVPFDQTQYLDTITICSAFLNYQIQLEHSSGCVFTSNIQGDNFEDLIKPYIPIITAVSVDTATNDVEISWNVNPSEDTYGYIIYVQDDFGLWITLDTIYGINSTVYYHIGAMADQKIMHYSVAAFDSCYVDGTNPPIFQTSAKSPEHYTMLLEAELDICNISTTLDWTEYETWLDGVLRYEIYYTNTSNGIVEFADNVNSTQTTYEHTGLIRGETYCYYIRAISNNGIESWTNKFCIYIEEPSPPNTNYLSTATVTPGNDVEVKILTEATTGIGALVLERAEDLSGPFDFITSIVPTSNQETLYDFNADVNDTYYYYKISVQDSCGDIGAETNIAKTILLETQVNNDELKVALGWNAYEGWIGTILRYNIYRGVNGIFSGGPIATVPANVRAYEDDVSSFLNSEGNICYRVEAVESVNLHGIAETSFSNTNCASLQPIIWVPSGFMKNGINHEFKPVISLFDFYSYEMIIFNRWGNEVFRTSNYNEGWNGNTKKGDVSPEGTYVYMISFEDAAGITHISKGSITFLIAGE